ncbi:gephyrin-like molybdotransferase Glp [Pelomonas sp. SE-A7]|uniref:molybdopterin molybdotransferase MoeA n=1 Tax=Pelomonas sp. SE-A7 TaxID=3054953 RepID=UPI00259D097E|nr:gephyrin-like molybdotransferase Glp [Pelomonas sp. SE-A7]MDM4765858.1 molybdopterin molybdotransferase MoeA [Pelomonas sp. SE-A7]
MSLHEIAQQLAGYDPEALHLDQAREFIARLLPAGPGGELETLPLQQLLGRVLAEDLVCPFDVPPQDNSAMDGYALRGSELAEGRETRLRMAGTSLAGSKAADAVPPGSCQRIMTGAAMPAGLDTVVPQEMVRVEDGHVHIAPGLIRPGANRRRAGEDLARGQVALAAGRLLRPPDVGLLASLGQVQARVFPRLKVALLSTGNELAAPGQLLQPGQIYDSNRYTLIALLQRLGCVEPIDLGLVPDRPEALRAAIRAGAEQAQVLISSGGVSVGEADHTKQVLAELGDMTFWKLAMRPGRPAAVGRLPRPDGSQALLFGLPGNPVAVMVTFYALVREALLRLAGAQVEPLPLLRATSLQALRKKPGRTEYQRGIVSRSADGGWQVRTTGEQGSGILSSMSRANGLILLAHEQGDVAAGELLDVLPFEALM